MTKPADQLRPARRGSLRLSLRIASRDAAQHRARSLLVVALIAIPIIGLAALATIESSTIATPQETIRDTLGSSQARLTVVGAPDPSLRQDPIDPSLYENKISNGGYADTEAKPPVATVASYLPPGTRILTLRLIAVLAETATGIGSLSAIEGQPWDRAFAGRFAVLSGHVPTSASEIMATPTALVRLGVKVGQSVTLSQPRAGTFTVVGTMRDLTQLVSDEQLFGRAGVFDGIAPNKDPLSTSFYLPDLPVSWTKIQELNRDGITVLSRAVLLNPPPSTGIGGPETGTLGTLQGVMLLLPLLGFSLFEVALLAGAAFTVGAQQQQRALATLASVGGDRRMLARVVSASGVVLGLVGGIGGSAIGVAGAWVYMRLTSDGSIARYPGLHIDPVLTGGIIGFAVLAGWIAALIPARRASRIDVVSSLRGAARPARPSRKTPIIGVIVGLLGIALTAAGAVLLTVVTATDGRTVAIQQLTIALIVCGPILLQIAALIVTPLLLRAVSRLAARGGTGARLASRDIARNAPRSVPAVGAIMSTIFIASFLITYLAAAQAEQTADYEYQTAPDIVSAGFGPYGLQTAVTLTQASQLAEAMNSTLHVTNATILYGAVNPSVETDPKKGELYPVPEVNAAVRCTQLPAGPTPIKRGSLSIASPDCQGPGYLTDSRGQTHISVGSQSAIEVAIGTRLTPTSRAALAAGKVVALYPQYVRDGHVKIDWLTAHQMDSGNPSTGDPARAMSISAVVQQPPHAVYFDLLMTKATAHALGIRYAPVQIIARTGVGPSDAQSDALRAAAQAVTGRPGSINFGYEGGPPTYATPAQWALLALCALIALGAATVAIGLARAEGRRDEEVLGALGAPPRLRSAYGFWSAAIITGVGAIGGVLLGTVPGLAISESLVQPGGREATPFGVPWLPLLVAAFGLPLIIAIGGWLTAGRRRVHYNARAPIE